MNFGAGCTNVLQKRPLPPKYRLLPCGNLAVDRSAALLYSARTTVGLPSECGGQIGNAGDDESRPYTLERTFRLDYVKAQKRQSQACGAYDEIVEMLLPGR